MYSYCDVNRFEYPNSYMYTPYGGMEFLLSYFKCRRKAITSLRGIRFDKFQFAKVQPDCQTHLKLLEIQYQLEQGEHESALAILEHYVRRFEVAKRLRNSYPFKGCSDLAPLETHILFYEILIRAYWQHQDIRFVNVMLKIGDTLISILETLDTAEDVKKLVSLLEQEVDIIEALMDKLKVTK